MHRDIKTAGLVSSSQQGIHPRLQQTVHRHLAKDWAQPLHKPSVAAYALLKRECGFTGELPFILDSGCGTGDSTRQLARLFPAQVVIGVDQSRFRLAKSGVENGFKQSKNLILLRAELTTFWRLLAADNFTPQRHYLFYPNPWPKAGHMKRRWHGHPVFPLLMSLGGEIVMRCNWEIYAQEFAFAASIVSGRTIKVQAYQKVSAGLPVTSPFEKKYLQRGHDLYEVTIAESVAAALNGQ